MHRRQQQVQRQQHHGGNGQRPPELFGKFQVPQAQGQHEERPQSHAHAQQLLQQPRGNGGRRDGQAQGGEEKGQGLQLEARPPEDAVNQVQAPHHGRQRTEADADGVPELRRRPRPELVPEHCVKQGQQQRGHAGGKGLSRAHPALGLLALLLCGVGQKAGLHVAEGQHVPGLQRRGGEHIVPVQQHAVLAVQCVQGPAALAVPDKGGVGAGDGLVGQHHVGAAGASHQVFPVVQRQPLSVGEHQMPPGLLFHFALEQAAGAAHQDQKGQQRQRKAGRGSQNRRQHTRQRLTGPQPLHQRQGAGADLMKKTSNCL